MGQINAVHVRQGELNENQVKAAALQPGQQLLGRMEMGHGRGQFPGVGRVGLQQFQQLLVLLRNPAKCNMQHRNGPPFPATSRCIPAKNGPFRPGRVFALKSIRKVKNKTNCYCFLSLSGQRYCVKMARKTQISSDLSKMSMHRKVWREESSAKRKIFGLVKKKQLRWAQGCR